MLSCPSGLPPPPPAQLLQQQHPQNANMSQGVSSPNSHPGRIVRTLYKQLMRWCQATDSAIPLTLLVPPVSLQAGEQVDAYRMELLSAVMATMVKMSNHPPAEEDANLCIVRRVVSWLPPYTELSRKHLTIPVENSTSLTNVFRAVFRLNQDHVPIDTDDDFTRVPHSKFSFLHADKRHNKSRIAAAFQALKSLNELSTTTLSPLQQRRRLHADWQRQFHPYPVGAVVRNIHERWRGVVVDWSVQQPHDQQHEPSGKGRKSTLTTKRYASSTEDIGNPHEQHQQALLQRDRRVLYEVLLDVGDAQSMGYASPFQGVVAGQDDVELVQDPALKRIRNSAIRDCFDRFDRQQHRFVPNALKRYEYPVDDDSTPDHPAMSDPSIAATNRDQHGLTSDDVALCQAIVDSVQGLAKQLGQHIIEELDSANSNSNTKDPSSNSLIHKVQRRLASLGAGDVWRMSGGSRSQQHHHHHQQPQRFSAHTIPATSWAAFHIRALLDFSMEILDIMSTRRSALQNAEKAAFCLGDIVLHKKYGFRGVVIAWDPYPTVDVSRWDGLQSVTDPEQQPFYHVVPNPNDCVRAFGGERSFRYVCQDNLQLCPVDQRTFQVDLEPEWYRQASSGGGMYVAPPELRFKYGESIDNGLTERCLELMEHCINQWQLLARPETDELALPSQQPEAPLQLNLNQLVALLRIVDSMQDATAVQDMIKDIRKAHKTPTLRWKLDTGMTKLMAGKGEQARETYRSVLKEDPGYAEAWNKLATCEFMMGKLSESWTSTQRALELNPSHVQALNGLGLIHYERDEYQQAANCFRKSIEMDPWSPVSSKLSMCLDLMSQSTHRDELSR